MTTPPNAFHTPFTIIIIHNKRRKRGDRETLPADCLYRATATCARIHHIFANLCPSSQQVFHFASRAWGQSHVNYVLDMLMDNDAFVYVHDDDTMLHPELPRIPLDRGGLIVGQHVGKLDPLIVKQLWKRHAGPGQYLKRGAVISRVRPAQPSYVRPKWIDQGQYMVRRGLIGSTRYVWGVQEADGVFIETVYTRHRRDFMFVDRGLCYYNALDDWCGMRTHTKRCERGVYSSCYSRTKAKGDG